MEDAIRKNIDQPHELERLYQSNRRAFRKAFDAIFQECPESTALQHWQARLHHKGASISWGTRNDALFMLVVAVVAIVIDHLPDIFGFSPDVFYRRNQAFVYLPALIAYFAWRQQVSWKKLVPVAAIIIGSAVHINLLPVADNSDTLILAYVHLPVFIWMVFGFVFTGNAYRDPEQRMEFLRFNGDLVVFSTILGLGMAALSVTTIGLFAMIGFSIEEFYVRYILMSGMSIIPLTAAYFVRFNPNLVDKVSPIIAKVFAPLVLLVLLIFLSSLGFAPKDLYNEHEFLLIFNVLLVVVTALVFFSVSETADTSGSKIMPVILLLLTVVTFIIAVLALSALSYRSYREGITPNRLAAIGTDLLLLVNLLLLSYRLWRALSGRGTLNDAGKSIAHFLPAYAVWAAFVTFVFPFLFNYR